MQTVVEFHEFVRKAEKEFGAEVRENIVNFLSQNPKAGNKLENFGGIRKLEWSKKGEKTGTNIFYHSGSKILPLVVIGVFRKGEKMILEKIIEISIHGKLYYRNMRF